MNDDPKMPEPAHPATYYCNKCGHYGPTGPAHANCNYNAVQYGPHYSAEQLLAYAAALAAARVAQERERCARVADDLLTNGRSPHGRRVADAIRQQPPETGKEGNLALDRRPICSADGCSRREPCGFACRDNGNFSNCPAKPPETGKEKET